MSSVPYIPASGLSTNAGQEPPSARVTAARRRAEQLAAVPWRPVPARPGDGPRRHFLVGDPQTQLHRFLAILDRHGLLGDDGLLRPDRALLSIGDHFDHGSDVVAAATDGLQLLRWLAEHPPDQVVLIAGNHDLSRVTELWRQTDAGFGATRQLAEQIRDLARADDGTDPAARDRRIALEQRFAATAPDLPTPEIAHRDFSAFTEAQRSLVQALLLAGRLRLAQAASAFGRPLLVTHASVTSRELRILGAVDERDPVRLASLLDGALDAAVAKVAPAWRSGEAAPLDLAPLHVRGIGGIEGGGMLYHRPSNPDRPSDDGRFVDRRWYEAIDDPRPRRFHPATLPRGLVQACGHVGHRKLVRELGPWSAPSARAVDRGGLRTLRSDGATFVYEAGATPAASLPPGEAVLYLIDGEMNHVSVESYPLLEVDGWRD